MLNSIEENGNFIRRIILKTNLFALDNCITPTGKSNRLNKTRKEKPLQKLHAEPPGIILSLLPNDNWADERLSMTILVVNEFILGFEHYKGHGSRVSPSKLGIWLNKTYALATHQLVLGAGGAFSWRLYLNANKLSYS